MLFGATEIIMRLKLCFTGTVELGPEAIETVKESISSLIQAEFTGISKIRAACTAA